MKIVFIVNESIAFDGTMLEKRPLGGIETAVIRLAEELLNLGQDVVVVTQHDNPPLSEVPYLPLRALNRLGSVDVLVCVRDWKLALLDLSTKRRFFWTGDSYDQPVTFGISDHRIKDKIDLFLCVSNWHRETFARESQFPLERMRVLRNGVHLPYFEGDVQKNWKRLAYSSMPYRGLAFLPEIFKGVKSTHGDAELAILSGYKTYEGSVPTPPHMIQQYELILDDLKKNTGVHVIGNVKQSQLAKEFMQASILAYPNTFEETSCISAMEAIAAGCVVITSEKGALPETVGESGVFIKGEPGTKEYTQHFINAVSGLLSDSDKLKVLSKKNIERAKKEFGWQQRAKEFLALI